MKKFTADGAEISQELIDHLTLNRSKEVYRGLPGEFANVNGRWDIVFHWDKFKNWMLADARKNLELIEKRKVVRLQHDVPLVGDFVRHPDGRMLTISVLHRAERQGQSDVRGSCYMYADGIASYSGTCGDLFDMDHLVDTLEVKDNFFWFFSEDLSGGGRGIYFYCPVRVWDLIG